MREGLIESSNYEKNSSGGGWEGGKSGGDSSNLKKESKWLQLPIGEIKLEIK